ncbi:MAG TPA: hypothetical protein VH740_26710 [Vicinamibacterales bacterium]|jgi:hypothetical protein
MVQPAQNILTALGPSKEFDEPITLGRSDEGTDERGFLFEIWRHIQTDDQSASWQGLANNRRTQRRRRSMPSRPSAVADRRALGQFQSSAAFGWHAQAGDRVADSSVERLQSHL